MNEIVAQKIKPAAFESVRRVEGFDRIARDYPTYLTDESKMSHRPFEHLFFPSDESELAAVLLEMSRRRLGVTFAGARTGLVGGCVPQQGALVSLESFDRVTALSYSRSAEEWRVRAQCAVSLRELDRLVGLKRFPGLETDGGADQMAEIERFRQDQARYFYPPDPTELSASLGGTVVTNASGARTFRYGSTRDWIRGLRVMLPNAEILNIPRGKVFASASGEFILRDSSGKATSVKLPNYRMPATKNTCGFFAAPHMDLIDLFIGSEGSFGIVTEISVALLQRRPSASIVLFLESDDQAIDLVAPLRSDGRIQLDFLEFYSQNALDLLRRRQSRDPRSVDMPPIPPEAGAALFFELEFDPESKKPDYAPLEAAVTAGGGSLANSWAGYENRELERLKAFRHILPETINAIIADRKKQYHGLHKLGTDLAVPGEHMREMWGVYRQELTAADLEWVAFGHIGNSHVHVNILPRDMQQLAQGLALYQHFAKTAVSFGGSVSAEHGIGKLKVKFLKLMYTPEEIRQMQAVKKAIDPRGLLNPGIIFEPQRSES